MPLVFDGLCNKYDTKSTSLQALPSADVLNQIFVQQNLIGTRLQLADHLIKQYERDIAILTAPLDKYRLRPAGWALEHQFLSQDNFYAQAFRCDMNKPSFCIQTSVAVPVVLCSIAAELEAIESGVRSGNPLTAYYKNGITSVDSWFPWLELPDTMPSSVIQTALDAAILIYFHETAHVLFGHCDYSPQDADEERALEMDADFNAGTMFSSWLKGLDSESGRKSNTTSETVDRLIRSGFILGTALKVFSGPSERYHYPSTRLMTFYMGGVFGLTRAGETPSFQTDELGNSFWQGRISQVREPLLNALRKSSLAYYAGTESDLQKDINDLMEVTHRVRNRLKDGPLQDLMIPI